ncbi:MAG: GAF domain-containing protein [Chloroflexi bacterium]|nr:GAF domain-containing protein [Chloroflexota bacterium]
MSAQSGVFAEPVSVFDFADQLRRRFLLALVIIGIVTMGTGFISLFLTNNSPYARIVTSVALVVSIIALILLWQGRIQASANLTIILFVASAVSSPTAIPVLGALALITAATLGSRRVYILTNIIILSKTAADALLAWPGFSLPLPPRVSDGLILFLSLVVISFSTRFLINQAARAAGSARQTANLLQAVAEIGQSLSNLLDMDELFNRSVEMIRDRLGFYHVQMFLVEADAARLVASTGDIGKRLLERRHQLPVGSQSVIGQVTLQGRPVIARHTDAVYYRNELLPDTRAELAVPIMDGERIIGALDVQSRDANAFDAERVRALQVMANLLGSSVRNARLFELQARSAAETKRLYLESETSLREIQRLNQQLTREGWSDYLHHKHTVGGVTLEDGQIVSDNTWTENLIQAARDRQPVMAAREDGSSLVALPVVLGSEVIGAIEIETPQPVMQAETVEMMRAVAQRLAVSLDKARLFEDSQEATAQEQRINEIVARYQTITDVDTLLRVTLTELSQSLGATRGAIRLSLADQEDAVS